MSPLAQNRSSLDPLGTKNAAGGSRETITRIWACLPSSVSGTFWTFCWAHMKHIRKEKIWGGPSEEWKRGGKGGWGTRQQCKLARSGVPEVCHDAFLIMSDLMERTSSGSVGWHPLVFSVQKNILAHIKLQLTSLRCMNTVSFRFLWWHTTAELQRQTDWLVCFDNIVPKPTPHMRLSWPECGRACKMDPCGW